MGTDITWFVEVQDETGAWQPVDFDANIYRNYQAFFALSGIRDDIVRSRGHTQIPFFEPRFEMPTGASEETRQKAEYEDMPPWDHRTLEELLAHDWAWTESNIVDTFERMKKLGPPHKVRAIWWFSF